MVIARQLGIIVAIATTAIATLNCGGSTSQIDVAPPVNNQITLDAVSRLEPGVIVSFPATLAGRSDGNCVELFVGDDFRKYGGDGKYSILSSFAVDSSADGLAAPRSVIITG